MTSSPNHAGFRRASAEFTCIHEPLARTNVASGLPVWASVPVMHNPGSIPLYRTDGIERKVSSFMFHSGDAIGPYALMRPLGRGTFGEVWLAERRSSLLTTQVALKLPHDADTDLNAIRQEAQIWLKASGHPNIVPVLDAEVYDGQVVIASEYVAGGSLADWLAAQGGRAQSFEAAVVMVRGILDGLQHLHETNLIHRDLKPGNVLVQKGKPRLTDFGLTRVLRPEANSTNMAGTPAYMAPEAFKGHYSPSSDIWAAGVILYKLIVGALPYSQPDFYPLLLAITGDEPVAPAAQVPAALSAVLTRALAKPIGERYGSAAEMAAALEPFGSAVKTLASSSIARSDRAARIAHVLALELIDGSRVVTADRLRQSHKLTSLVTATAGYLAAKTVDGVEVLPATRGLSLIFFNDVLAPVQTAVEIVRSLPPGGLHVRMGIHSGLVVPQMDAGGRDNLGGEGVNTAQRVMALGEAGHILLSAQYANWLKHFPEWSPSIHPVSDYSSADGSIVSIYTLAGPDFGLTTPPGVQQVTSNDAGAADAKPGAAHKSVMLLYKPNLEPDAKVLRTLEARLRDMGHDVFVDSQQKISAAWAQAVEEPIRRSDAVIAIVSPESLRSEMLEYEIETAHDQFLRTGKPVLLPVRIGADDRVDGPVASILQPLHFFSWSCPGDDERLVAELVSAITEPLRPCSEGLRLEPVGGAVPPDSPFYVRRACDSEFLHALDGQESILLVKGARQIGKTSLLAQGAKRSRESGRRVVVTDFQKFNTAQMNSDEAFYRLLAATIDRQVKFQYDFKENWDEIFGANLNMENFLRDLLDGADQPLVWYMDEVDKLFAAPFASDFFGLVRSWHNSRSTEPDGPWSNLTVVIAYATEAHLFIQDLNQSPFNVGRRLNLEDFNIQQTIDLNARYGGPLASYSDTETLHALIGGQPFLTRCALDALATGRESLATLMANADADEGPFNDHLKRILISVSRLPEVREYVSAVLLGNAQPNQDSYFRLVSAGVLCQNEFGKVVFRCELYRRYLKRMTNSTAPS